MEIFPLRCRVYRKRLSLPFGVDDSIAAAYLCQQNKAMKNGKHKTNSFNSSNSWSKKTNSLPFREGVGVGFLTLPFREGQGVGFFPSPSATHPQNKCFKCFKCFRCFISLLDQKNARFWSKSEQNRCFTCFAPKRNSSPSELPFG